MEQLLEYRERLFSRLSLAAEEFRAAVQAVGDPYAPRQADRWNVHQLAVHVRDVHKLVYGQRIRRTLEEQDPLFENFAGDAYMADHYDPHESLSSILDGLVESVHSTVAGLRDLPPEAWKRGSRHATYGGGFTAQTWVERCLAHIEEHLKSVRD